MSDIVVPVGTEQKLPRIKKTDWIYYWLFHPVFWLPLWVTPNHVSYLRIVICIPTGLMIYFSYSKPAGILFILAALMDGLDGAMARIRNQVSDFGKLLDPLADKILNITSYLAFLPYVKAGTYIWFTLPIVTIDTVLAFVATTKYLIHFYLPNLPQIHWLRSWFDPQIILDYVQVEETGANSYGKAKMVVQVVNLSAMMLFDPNADYFVFESLKLPAGLVMYDFFVPLFIASIVLGVLSLWGHLKVVHIKQPA